MRTNLSNSVYVIRLGILGLDHCHRRRVVAVVVVVVVVVIVTVALAIWTTIRIVHQLAAQSNSVPIEFL